MVMESREHLRSPEPGFLTMLSIEALYEVLEEHGLTPKCQLPTTTER